MTAPATDTPASAGYHPVIEAILTDPQRVWHSSELAALCPDVGNVRGYLDGSAKNGVLERVPLGRHHSNGTPLVGFRLRRLPRNRRQMVEAHARAARAEGRPPLQMPDEVLAHRHGRMTALLMVNRDHWWRRCELTDALGVSTQGYAGTLARLVASGYVQQRGERGALEFRLVSAPKPTRRDPRTPRPAPRSRTPQALQPPVAGDYHPVVALLLANRGCWVRRLDVRHALPGERAGVTRQLTELVQRGEIERRGQEYCAPEGWAPLTRTERREAVQQRASGWTRVERPKRVRVRAERPAPQPKPAEPTPAQLARQQQLAEQKRERLAREAAIREELRVQREQSREEAQHLKEERRREQERLNLEIQRGDREALRAWMASRPGQSFVEGEAQAALGLPTSRTRNAIRGLESLGLLLADRSDHAVRARYRLLDPELPQVPAVMTAGAVRVLDALQGRPAETELGLMRSTGYAREEVRAGLARLHALGRLGWGAVGHLILYRLVEVRAQAGSVAA